MGAIFSIFTGAAKKVATESHDDDEGPKDSRRRNSFAFYLTSYVKKKELEEHALEEVKKVYESKFLTFQFLI
jgi:hypothetical protein